MEILYEILLTLSLAISLSFLVAKIVSIALSGEAGLSGSDSRRTNFDGTVAVGEVSSGEKLKVQASETQRKVKVFVREVVEKVSEFQGESMEVLETVEIGHRSSEEAADEGRRFPEVSRGEKCGGGESHVVQLPEISTEVRSGEESDAAFDLTEKSLREKSVQDFEGKGVGEVVELPEKSIGQNEKTGESVSEANNDDFEGPGVDIGEPYEEADAKSLNENQLIPNSDREDNRIVESELKEGDGGKPDKEERVDSDEDDWEGIEKSDLEKVFAAATKFVGDSGSGNRDGGLSSIGSDIEMELYGLHKVATEGPCREPQPMALWVSARAKWNAWQKMGNMTPDVAMEQYISLLSDRVPGWTDNNYLVELGSGGTETLGSAVHDPSTPLIYQSNPVNEREPELKSSVKEGDTSDVENKAKQ